jgi:hypothetical protein
MHKVPQLFEMSSVARSRLGIGWALMPVEDIYLHGNESGFVHLSQNLPGLSSVEAKAHGRVRPCALEQRSAQGTRAPMPAVAA